MTLWTAFVLGFLGSIHCAGMCGPIAISLPLDNMTQLTKVGAILQYNTGRIIGYAILGLLPGVLGMTIFLSGYQSTISVILGALLIIIALLLFFGAIASGAPGFFGRLIESIMSRFASHNSPLKFLSFGVANGFLPCGLVYAAIAGALSQESVASSLLYMITFGIGTIPMMFSIPFLAGGYFYRLRKWNKYILPLALLVVGALFLVRGLNVELPFHINSFLLREYEPMCH